MGVDLCTYRARIGCFRNPAFGPLCCWQSCLLVWMAISQLMLKLAGDVEENPGPRQQNITMVTLSSFQSKVKPKEWDMMGKRTLMTLDLSREDYSHIEPLAQLPKEVFELKELEALDLTNNKNIDLSDQLTKLTNLKLLCLDKCGLKTVPAAVMKLPQLEMLDLSGNQVQTLPAEIGQLTNVKHLNMSNCELRTLPPEVWRLTQLERLDLRDNQLQTLPAEIGQLTNVKHLDLSKCVLRTLPPGVGRLTQLERLNLSQNKLQTLPAEVGQLSSLRDLNVWRNPLIKPPVKVCREGIAAIRLYFDELERSKEAVSAHLKVVVLGETMAGKTSLVRTLDSGESTLTEEEDRTHCVEITQWAPDDNITFEVYDFGGHDVYHLTHQFFLSPDAFHLLLVNLQTYSCSVERYTEAVGFWLDTLNARVPGAVVTIVGSKKDKCSEAEINDKVKDIKEKFQQQMDTWKSNTERQITTLNKRSKEAKSDEEQREIKQQLEHAKNLLDKPMRLTDKHVHCISSAEASGLDTLKNHIVESANNTDLFPTLKKILPRTWADFEKQMHKLRDNGTEKLQSTREDDDDSSALHLQSDKKPMWLTRNDCLLLGQYADLTENRLEPVLSYLQQVGTILRYTDIPELKDLVFHDPPALIEIFKDLFHHDVKKLFKTPRLKNADYTRTQLDDFEQDLRDCGLIQKKVMSYMLLPNIDPDVVIALMQDFGLCFELKAKNKTDPSKHACQYRITWYLHKQMPEELMNVWPDDVPEDQEQLQLMCNITGFCPRGLFQRFSVRIHQLIEDRIDWKDGVMAYRQAYRQDYPVLVRSNPVPDDTYITMATRGRLDQAEEMWGVVHPLLEVLVQLLQEWPGVLYSLHVTCAHCIKAGLDRPYQHELRDRTAEDGRDVRCPRVKKTASTSADLVYRPARSCISSRQLKRSRENDASGNPRKKLKVGKDEAAGMSRDNEIPVILLLNDEYGTSKGGISTVNCQASQTLKGKAVVYCTVLQLNVPGQDQEAADKDGVTLIQPVQLGKESVPSLDWLTYYHRDHFPDLPPDVTCIIGHADITDTAARNIKDQRYPQADLIMFTHVLPEDTEYYKGGRKAMKAREKEKDMLDKVDNAKAAFSVGKRIYDHCSTKYKGKKKPQNHHIFLPKPSEIFLDANVSPGGGEKVVLSIGRVRKVEKLKGHDLAGQSLREVVKIIKNARWCVRGISEDDFETSKKILEDALNSGDLNPTLLPYGTQEDIRDDMMTAHLVLMPSRSEPFGLVGLEAIAAGIPVLISDKTGLAEMITDLIDQGKLSAEHRHVIVETSVNDRDRAVDTKRWAKRIVDILEHSDSEFKKAARFKRELVESRYWEESHNAFLQACGITAGAAD